MYRPSHLQRSAHILREIRTGSAPADKVLERFFRQHREMGARDRGYVAETVYGVLRNRRVLEHLCGSGGGDEDQVTAYLTKFAGVDAETLARLDSRTHVPQLLTRVNSLDPGTFPAAIRANLPDELWANLSTALGDDEALQLALAMNQPAPVDLRVNTLKATRAAAQSALAAEGFPSQLTAYSPVGLRRADRKPLFNTAAFKSGLFEIQDEGSQLLSLLVGPQPGERVVDFCAGGGGKTLHLGALMQNKGTLYAFDVHSKRLDQLKPRLIRAGLDNVRVQVIADERDTAIKRLRGTVDRVLVDAPCSGTGTLRRNPDIKWRALDFTALHAQQKSILDAAALLVKPGGRLVYATCSVLREENEGVAAAFLETHSGFVRVPVNDVLKHCGVELAMSGPELRLYPHRHGTDGFFAAVFERVRDDAR